MFVELVVWIVYSLTVVYVFLESIIESQSLALFVLICIACALNVFCLYVAYVAALWWWFLHRLLVALVAELRDPAGFHAARARARADAAAAAALRAAAYACAAAAGAPAA